MGKLRKIPVEDLKSGMIFDEAVFVDTNNILVPAHVPLREDDIKKLMTWGVSEIETSGELILDDAANSGLNHGKRIIDQYNDLLKKRKKLLDIYQNARTSVNKAYTAIKNDSELELDPLTKTVDDIIQITHENSNIFLFLYGLEEDKDYMVTHAINVTFYAVSIGIALKYNMESLRELGLGTLLINTGMIKVPTYITRKKSNLTEQEFNQVKTHPLHGYKALKKLTELSDNIANISLQHHEQFDGKGYPRGISGLEIDEYARIASIADSYESQISNRSYRTKLDFYKAMRNLLSSGVNRYDPDILRVFLSKMSVYPIGSLVEMNDSSIGIVIGSIPEKPLRPIIKLIFDDKKNRIEETVIRNLLNETTYYIVKARDESELGINIFDVL